MNNKFEDDEVLAQLSKAARKTKAPKLDESIIQSAMLSKPKFGPRKFLTPALMFNLAGGAAVLAGVFVFTGPLGTTNQPMVSSGTMDQFSKKLEGSALLAQGDVKITEEDLLARDGVSLAEHGLSAIGNYVSNSPAEYVDEVWTGQGGTSAGNPWVFVVTEDVYISNGEVSDRLSSYFTEDKLSSYPEEDRANNFLDEIAPSSEAEGIRLLIQGDDNVLHPLVVPVNEEPGSLYMKIRDEIESSTFTQVPTF